MKVTEATSSERADLVDVFYAPFVRPLGNLVILYAQAEAALLALWVDLTGCTEKEAQKFLGDTTTLNAKRRQIVAQAKKAGIPGHDLNEVFRGDQKLLPRPRAEASTYTRQMICQFAQAPCRTENSRSSAAKEGRRCGVGVIQSPRMFGNSLDVFEITSSLFTYLSRECTAAKREAEEGLVEMKVAQPLSVTIRQIEFELEKAEHGMGMPYDAERVGQLRKMLVEARKKKLSGGLKARREQGHSEPR